MTTYPDYNHHFASVAVFSRVCGINDGLLPLYEARFGIRIVPRGQDFILPGIDAERARRAGEFFRRLEAFAANQGEREELDEVDIRSIANDVLAGDNSAPGEPSEPAGARRADYAAGTALNQQKLFTTFAGKPVYPKTRNQEYFVRSTQENQITLAVGPAGTGKTYLSVVMACAALTRGRVERIILTRPAVEAGENLGFLPGDMARKVDPYLRPLYDGLYECLGFEKVQQLIAGGQIEIAPLAFMRGRTLSQSYILLDEAQNCTYRQLKMFLTRLGRNSTMIVSGDVSQTDLRADPSGLRVVMGRLRGIAGIGLMEFGVEDITRHPLVEKLVRALGDD